MMKPLLSFITYARDVRLGNWDWGPMSEKEATPGHGGFSRSRYAEPIQLGFLGGHHYQTDSIVAI